MCFGKYVEYGGFGGGDDVCCVFMFYCCFGVGGWFVYGYCGVGILVGDGDFGGGCGVILFCFVGFVVDIVFGSDVVVFGCVDGYFVDWVFV